MKSKQGAVISDRAPVELASSAKEAELAQNAHAVFDRYQQRITEGLAAAVTQLPEETVDPSRYHIGLLPGGNSGKALRPTLTLLLAEGLEADPELSGPLAVAVQLVHDFSLLHDDIVDGDRSRRGQPALWVRNGLATALNTGDALLTVAFCSLAGADLPPGMVARATHLLGKATLEMVGGQQADIAATGAPPAQLAPYLDMVERKTGALMGAASALGAVAAVGGDDTVAAAEVFGRTLGVAFQLRDDVLGVFGDSEQTGKPVGNDLLRGKLGLPLLLALTAKGELASTARSWLEPGGLEPSKLDQAVDLLRQAGVADRCQGLTTAWTEKAIAAAAKLPVTDAVGADLEILCRWLGERWT